MLLEDCRKKDVLITGLHEELDLWRGRWEKARQTLWVAQVAGEGSREGGHNSSVEEMLQRVVSEAVEDATNSRDAKITQLNQLVDAKKEEIMLLHDATKALEGQTLGGVLGGTAPRERRASHRREATELLKANEQMVQTIESLNQDIEIWIVMFNYLQDAFLVKVGEVNTVTELVQVMLGHYIWVG